MMIKESSLRRDPDLGGELAFLAKGCDFVLPSRFKRRLKAFQQAQVWTLGISLSFFLYFFNWIRESICVPSRRVYLQKVICS